MLLLEFLKGYLRGERSYLRMKESYLRHKDGREGRGVGGGRLDDDDTKRAVNGWHDDVEMRDQDGEAEHGKDEFIKEFEYRNLAPLYADEPIRLCLVEKPPWTRRRKGDKRREGERAKGEDEEKGDGGVLTDGDGDGDGDGRGKAKGRIFDLWAETVEGGYAVKARAWI